MKKIIIGILILSSISSFSSVRLTSDRIFFGLFTSNATKEITKDSFDFENDLAVASNRFKNIDDAHNDALKGLSESIREYSGEYMKELLLKTNLSGKNFDNTTMYKMAREVANAIIENKKYEEAKIIEIKENGKYLVVYKVSREEVKKQSEEIFRERLYNVIQRLYDYYRELGE